MNNEKSNITIGRTPLLKARKGPTGSYVDLLGETFYCIRHVDQMVPFFMTLVSSSDHWLFIASNGGLTAGRRNPDSALFPYETEDKILAHSEQTGGKTSVRVTRDGRTSLWEPFSDRYAGLYSCDRHLYKNIPGNIIILEEVNHDLGLTLRTAWRTSDRFGFVRSCWLENDIDSACGIDVLDGLENLLPYGATAARQRSLSNLLNAYKRNEIETRTGLGIFSLSATLSDRAEPSEALQATVAWQVGLDGAVHLLCTDQYDAFRHGDSLIAEQDMRGKAGSYLVNASFTLAPEQAKRWHIVADVNQDSAAVVRLAGLLSQDRTIVEQQLEGDIKQGTADLISYVASSDGIQVSAQKETSTHHFANVLFNIMRGGIFSDGYRLAKRDLMDFVHVRNRPVLIGNADWFAKLPDQIGIGDLYARASASDSPDLIRLCYEYLPLTFSRRHGDPSRPWNQFSINVKQADGTPRLDYQGNWRDIFQNWEPLALTFPGYIEGMIAKFLNATTVDGYNPYRITRDGIEWEVPEPDNPWSNIGYWSDHQIIYLQKLLEVAERLYPGQLGLFWNRPIYAYANVPYRLRTYQEMLADWSNSIEFDWKRERETEKSVARLGTDGRLQLDASGEVIHVTLMEKLLVLFLAKITNLVPGGGVWMNTQRPEWNDANNALVGKGLSVVTTSYLRRFIAFWQAQLDVSEESGFAVNTAVANLFADTQAILSSYQNQLDAGFSDQARRAIMDALGSAASDYRSAVYQEGVPPGRIEISKQMIWDFLALAQAYVEQTLHANRRHDGLYHAYNLLRLGTTGIGVGQLYPMLEGQVAVLSSGILRADEVLLLLQSLRDSDLYRPDQHTYLLYPDRQLPGFLSKNRVSPDRVAGSKLVDALTRAGDRRLLIRDEIGDYHFQGTFHNANDLARILDELEQEPAYAELVGAERAFILDLFETIFDHRAFTGRSGTFFAYEGLGSVYWHMVAKLLLAVQECYMAAASDGTDSKTVAALASAYHDIRRGLGFNKSPAEYGAFPTDPYSHTPSGGGARQPGMTGQVKEEILTRLGELGVSIRQGAVQFAPTLLQAEEFLTEPGKFVYVDTTGQRRTLQLPADSLAFTLCQTPVIYTRGDGARIEVNFADGRTTTHRETSLDVVTSRHIFDRDGQVRQLHVNVQV